MTTRGHVLSRDELRTRREQLSRMWAQVVAPGAPSAARAPSVSSVWSMTSMPHIPLPSRPSAGLLASWRRSSVQVDPELAAAPVDDSDLAVTSWRRSGLAVGLRSVEDDVRRAADDGGLVAAVTDSSGRIVWTYGSRVMQRRSEAVGFVPGGHWDEDSVGTNALALALRTGRPSTVYSAEHFSRAVHGWVCYAVPLTDPRTGAVRGVLDLSTTWDRAHPLAMTTAGVLGRLVTAAAAPEPDTGGPALQLSVLGGWRVRVDGTDLALPHRQLEVLVLLSLHPAGLSLEDLHARLYGDARVSKATLKAEVSHLRTALRGAVGSRPYRLGVPVESDLRQVLQALDRGDVRTAVASAGGPLLPGSESPEIREWRAYVEVALRTAVLASTDVDVVLAGADAHSYDAQLQEHLIVCLPEGDPRRAGARARLQRALS